MSIFRYRKHMESVQIHKDIRQFVVEYVEKNGLFPRTKVIADALDISESGVRKHLRDLECEEILVSPSWGDTTTSIAKSEELASILNYRMVHKQGGSNQRLAIMLGMLTKDKNHPVKANIPSRERSRFSQEKWQFLLNAPFDISNNCCTVMKKAPAHKYHRETGRNPIIATMAAESKLRTRKWLQNGCNGFDLTIPTSNPMSFWTKQDVLAYIKENDLPICSVYGNVIIDYEAENNVEGQLNLSELSADMGNFNVGSRPLKTTGCSRTGCVLCGFGCHLEKPNEARFIKLKQTHPKMYGLLDKISNNGYTYRQAIDWINSHGNTDIRY